MGTFYQPAPKDEGSRWRPIIVAGVFALIIAVVIWWFARQAPPEPTEAAIAPYAENIVFSDIKLSRAQNFVGGEITYVEGKVSNVGGATVTNATVQAVFRNMLGEVVQRESVPLQVFAKPLGEPDFVPLSAAPLTPNASFPFRLTFEHVSADWNQGVPELRVIRAETK